MKIKTTLWSIPVIALFLFIGAGKNHDYKVLKNGVSLSTDLGELTVTVPRSGSVRVQCNHRNTP